MKILYRLSIMFGVLTLALVNCSADDSDDDFTFDNPQGGGGEHGGTDSGGGGSANQGGVGSDGPGGIVGGGGMGGTGGGGGGVIPNVPECVQSEGAAAGNTNVWNDQPIGSATVVMEGRDTCARTYTLSTTATLRSPATYPNSRVVVEVPGWPTLRSGHDMFDALYALSLDEVRQNSVDVIHDWGFNNGADVPCGVGGCFETGKNWNYVWTRDTSYSVDLGLAAIDPVRCVNSLLFKLSEMKTGGGTQIVQDTGSGGSYPVSTDRVSWAVGAAELLHHLDGPARAAFRDKAFDALRNTIEHDRDVAYDPIDGLYRGEQSFLDWRENTYPGWTATDVVHIGMSKSLSTNLLHYRAMDLASTLADETGDNVAKDRYRGFANGLKTAIQNRLWLDDDGLFSTYSTTWLDQSPVRRYDLLGSAFAVLFGVASAEQAKAILSRYPHYGPGAPVIWPQQQDTAIYHNRGEWPFVTAYWLRAAKIAGNDAVATRMIRALIRGTAINLSNMENFEAATGAAFVEEPPTSGPVVNSERQLWSVAGFLSMVHHTLFGVEALDDGLHIRPFVPASLRSTLFAGSSELALSNLPYKGNRITVVLHLPPSAGTGVLVVQSIRLNNEPVSGDLLPAASLQARNTVDVQLGTGTTPNATITVASTVPEGTAWQNVFGPKTPSISSVADGGTGVRLTVSAAESAVSLRVYKDGNVVADNLPASTVSWTDSASSGADTTSPCYSIEATFLSSGTHSQHSEPKCWWGTSYSHITEFPSSSLLHNGGVDATDHGRPHIGSWGDVGHTITVPLYTASTNGRHLIQLTYGNGAGSIDTGITCGVKHVEVRDKNTGTVVGAGYAIMPHLGKDDWDRWSASSFVPVNLTAGGQYEIIIGGGARAINMSSFKHFVMYTGGMGGGSDAFNRVNISHVKVLAKP